MLTFIKIKFEASMKKPLLPKNESARLAALQSYKVLDTDEESSFDDITTLAAQICGTPIALISLVDENRQWFKSHLGLDAKETPRELAFCAHAIHGNEIFEIPDALKDQRFHDNPLVTSAPNVVFYAGAPLTTPEGLNIGTLCVIDHEAKKLSEDQLISLRALSRLVIGELELRKKQKELMSMNLSYSNQKMAIDSSAIVVETDTKGLITYVNEKFINISQYSKEELIGQDHRILNSGFHPKEFIADLWNTISSGKIWKGEIKNKAKDGSFYWVDTTIYPLKDDKQMTCGYVAIRFEITNRKIMELNLKENTETLSKANIELDQFAYVVSHDLKAPLRAIHSLSQWIREDTESKLSEESDTNFKLLQSRTLRLEELIKGILAYSRVGRESNTYEKLSSNQLIADTVDLLSPPKSFKIEIQENMPDITADKVQISQIFSNLIGNAVKYHHKNNGVIKINCKSAEDYWEFSITDDGPGISPKYHQKVFEIFSTLESRDKIESTGIGLSIVKKMVENYGGKIWIDSEEGSGASFIFTWPKNISTDNKGKSKEIINAK